MKMTISITALATAVVTMAAINRAHADTPPDYSAFVTTEDQPKYARAPC
jgi:hypothetical protein